MAYKPFKMKGHTLPGIKQRPSAKMADGRASSSPLQDNGEKFDQDTVRSQEIRKGIKDYTPEQIQGVINRNINAYQYGHLDKGEQYRTNMPDYMDEIALRSDSLRATLPQEMLYPVPKKNKKEAKKSSPAKSNGEKYTGPKIDQDTPRAQKIREGIKNYTPKQIQGIRDRNIDAYTYGKLPKGGSYRTDGTEFGDAIALMSDSVRATLPQEVLYPVPTKKVAVKKEKSSPNKWAQFIPAAISAISAIKKSKEDK